MRLLRLAVETQKWELAAHVLILGTIKARQKENGKPVSKQRGKRLSTLAPESRQGQRKKV